MRMRRRSATRAGASRLRDTELDIASTAWDEGTGRAKFNPEYNVSGSGTGVGVRLLVQLMRDWKAN